MLLMTGSVQALSGRAAGICSSPEHKRAIGAARAGHLDGPAFYMAITNHDPIAFEGAAREPIGTSTLRYRVVVLFRLSTRRAVKRR